MCASSGVYAFISSQVPRTALRPVIWHAEYAQVAFRSSCGPRGRAYRHPGVSTGSKRPSYSAGTRRRAVVRRAEVGRAE